MNEQEIKWDSKTSKKIFCWAYVLNFSLEQAQYYYDFYKDAICMYNEAMSKTNTDGTIDWLKMPSINMICKGEAYRDALIMRTRMFLKESMGSQEITLGGLINLVNKNNIQVNTLFTLTDELKQVHGKLIDTLIYTADKRIAHHDYNAMQEKLALGQSLLDNNWEGFFNDVKFIIKDLNRKIDDTYEISRNNGGATIDLEPYLL